MSMEFLRKDTAFIISALPRWDGQYASASFALSKEIAKTHKVFYIDNPFTVKDFILHRQHPRVKSRTHALLFGRKIYKNLDIPGSDITIVTPRLVAPINWIDNNRIYDLLSKINNWLVARVLRKIIRDHQLTDYIFINSFNPFYFRSFPEYFKPRLFIYHTVDDISEAKYIYKHGRKLEKEVNQRADFTIVTSMKLKSLKERESEKVYYLPNAVDISVFQKAFTKTLPVPEDIIMPERDIIIFTGHIDQRIDVSILEQIATSFPDQTLLLIGPNSLSKQENSLLSKYGNILFTGKKTPEELPAYLQLARCAIIPFRCNTFTESIYPLKVNEYLAAGLPVVSTPFSEDIKAFASLVYMANSPAQFVAMIQQAMKEDSAVLQNKRMEGAKKNTWYDRAQQLYQWIDDHLKDQLLQKVPS